MALATTEQYVWIYSEREPRFFPPKKLPSAYLQAISAARNGGTSRSAEDRLLPVTLLICSGGAIATVLVVRRQRSRAGAGGFVDSIRGVEDALRGANRRYALGPPALHAIFWSPLLLFGLLAGAIALPATSAALIAMMDENQPIELLTFVFLVWAAALGLRLMSKARRSCPRVALLHAVFATGLLFVAMEEVAWGQFFLGFATPDWLQQINSQGVVTLHNLRGLDARTEFLRVIFGAGGLAAIYMVRTQPHWKLGAPAVLALWFVVILGHSVLDFWNDFIPIHDNFDHLVGELSEAVEMMIGMTALLFVWLEGRALSAERSERIE